MYINIITNLLTNDLKNCNKHELAIKLKTSAVVQTYLLMHKLL